MFALASASVAILILAFGDLAPAGQSLPAGIPGREIWIYGVALLVLAASAGLCFLRAALMSVLVIGAYLAVWAVVCVPQVLAKPFSIGGWYGFCEALSALLGAWILYAMLRGERGMRTARALFGVTCVFYGWSHFVYADFTATVVPTWLPGRLEIAYITGLAHIAAGIGIAVGVLPRLAASLESVMMGLFGLLVWVPSFFAQPRPTWATPPQNQWSELVVTLVLASSAWVVATSLRDRSWVFGAPARA